MHALPEVEVSNFVNTFISFNKVEINKGLVERFSCFKKIFEQGLKSRMKSVTSSLFRAITSEEIKKVSVGEISSLVGNRKLGVWKYGESCETCGYDINNCVGHFGHITLVKSMFHPLYIDVLVDILNCVCTECGKLRLIESGSVSDLPSEQFENIVKLCKSSTNSSTLTNSKIHNDCDVSKQPPIFRREKGSLQIFYSFISDDDENSSDKNAIHKKSKKRVVLETDSAKEILRKISKDDFKRMGIQLSSKKDHDNHRTYFEDLFIMKCIPVPPSQILHLVGEEEEEENNRIILLRNYYEKIIKYNEKLKKNYYNKQKQSYDEEEEEEEEEKGFVIIRLLEFLVWKIYRREFSRRIKSRIRRNLMGKRVNFCARSVITPCPNLSIHEIGIPISIAMKLTVPEIVNSYNLEKLKFLVSKGMAFTSLNIFTTTTLKIGMVVERCLQDHDFVLVNNQPCLDRNSLMGFSVRIKRLGMKSFRFHPIIYHHFVSRLLGDELNIHVPQSLQTRSELMEMMSLESFYSPTVFRSSLTQEMFLGCFLISKKNVFFPEHSFMNFLMKIIDSSKNDDVWVLPQPAILKPKKLWTGKQILSYVIPKLINMESPNPNFPTDDYSYENRHKRDFPSSDSFFVIKNGEIMSGHLCKKVFGQLTQLVDYYYGNSETMKFHERIHRLVVNQFLPNNGFSIGLRDMIFQNQSIINNNYEEKTKKEIEECKNSVRRLVSEAHRRFRPNPGMTVLDSIELQIQKLLQIHRCYQPLQYITRFLGGKKYDYNGDGLRSLFLCGNIISWKISKIMGCVGQLYTYQNPELPTYTFSRNQRICIQHDKNNKRILPHFLQGASSSLLLQSRGYVEHSYVEGLAPHEFFFDCISGREVRNTNYKAIVERSSLQRNLVKFLEDVHIAYDGTVRESFDGDDCPILQFIYGENTGIVGDQSAESSCQSMFEFVRNISDEEFFEEFHYNYLMAASTSENIEMEVKNSFGVRRRFGEGFMSPDMINIITSDVSKSENFRFLEEEFQQLLGDRHMLRTYWSKKSDFHSVVSPVLPSLDLKNMISTTQNLFGIDLVHGVSDLDPIIDVIASVKSFLNDFIPSILKKYCYNYAQYHENYSNVTCFLSTLFRTTFASKRVLKRYRLTKLSFEWLFKKIKQKVKEIYQNYSSEGGEMVGIQASQSIGRAFEDLVFVPFPRFKDLLYRNHDSFTRISAFLNQGVNDDNEMVESLKNRLEFFLLKDVVLATEIYYDPIIIDETKIKTSISEDQDLVEMHYSLMEEEEKAEFFQIMTPWILRFIIDKKIFEDRALDMYSIAEEIETYFYDNNNNIKVMVIVEDNYGEKLIIRIRFGNIIINKNNNEEEEDQDEPPPNNIIISVEYLKMIGDLLLQNIVVSGFKFFQTSNFSVQNIQIIKQKYKEYNPRKGRTMGEEWALYIDGVHHDQSDNNNNKQISKFTTTAFENILRIEDIDFKRTVSSNVNDILQALGIEAARKVLLSELIQSLESEYINIRKILSHLCLLVDSMCHYGDIRSIKRHNIIGNVFKKACRRRRRGGGGGGFLEIFRDSVLFQEKDFVKDVSSCIIHGRNSKIGTGFLEILGGER